MRTPSVHHSGLRASAVMVTASLILALSLDAPVARWVASAPAGWVRMGTQVSKGGLSGYMLVIAALLVGVGVLSRRRGGGPIFGVDAVDLTERACFFFVTIASSGILAQIVKHLVGRARPGLIETLGAFHFDGPTSSRFSLASFPSGHATTVFGAALALTMMAPRARFPLFAAALAISASRVLVHAHYLSDVVAGAGLGAAVTLAWAEWFARRGMVFSQTNPLQLIERRPPTI